MSKHITERTWLFDPRRVNANIIWYDSEENDGGIVCSIRADDYGRFPQAGVILYAPEMMKILVNVFNENKCGGKIMDKISTVLKGIEENSFKDKDAKTA